MPAEIPAPAPGATVRWEPPNRTLAPEYQETGLFHAAPVVPLAEWHEPGRLLCGHQGTTEDPQPGLFAAEVTCCLCLYRMGRLGLTA